jgi:ABC-type Zn2+ transport system substrate-binding protein/surface adhesin
MFHRFTLRLLIALQLLALLAGPANASMASDTQHSIEHLLLTQHHHEDASEHHHDHDSSLSEQRNGETLASGETMMDHHHHDFNLNLAPLLQASPLAIAERPIQNPRQLATMQSAELRLHLRPPQA